MASTIPSPSHRVGQSYWRAARASRYSLLFALPLLLLYEALAAALPVTETGGVRNGADVLLKSFFVFLAGARGPLLFGLVLIGGCLWLVRRDMVAHGARLRGWIFGAMFAESVGLALVFGAVVALVTAEVLGAFGALALAPMERLDVWTRLMVSLGAGLYEELLFRVILVSGLAYVGQRLLRWRSWVAGTVATVVGAFIFSAFHYVGAYGDVFTLQSFMFRMIAGIFFSALYLLRGFGIDAWTHALYDVFLLFH